MKAHLSGQRKRVTVSDRFKRGPWRSCRVDVEESCRLTRSKLLCISPTTCAHSPAREIPAPVRSHLKRCRRARNSTASVTDPLDPGRREEGRRGGSPCCSRSTPWLPDQRKKRNGDPPAGLRDSDDRYLFLRLTKDGGLREGGQKYVSDGVLRNCYNYTNYASLI